ncbi:MAG: hypothetical protein JSV12_03740 [Candidatus Bathyarchaeota archaeon]|nr:MAG: hypothetical protein JSV12_03740 [Candidatus Bathyarchaeota archaeon]
MPSFKIHCAISKKRTRNNFAELHRWIDESATILGYDHRIERHHFNKDDKNTIKRRWDAKREGLGEKAVIEWLFHIALDNLATAFRMSKKSFSYGPKTYNLMRFGLSKSGYIHCEFERVDERDLRSIFEDESEKDDY